MARELVTLDCTRKDSLYKLLDLGMELDDDWYDVDNIIYEPLDDLYDVGNIMYDPFEKSVCLCVERVRSSTASSD
ncbi:hypothetical protein SLA2020_261730 [Shorea laevis]